MVTNMRNELYDTTIDTSDIKKINKGLLQITQYTYSLKNAKYHNLPNIKQIFEYSYNY